MQMKRHILALCLAAVSATAMAQQDAKILRNGWFNHLDVAATVGTSGIGFDLATPMTDWARLRLGGVFRPWVRYDASFTMEVSEGLSSAEQSSRFDEMATKMQSLIGRKPTRTVDMEGDMRMNNFKFLVDIFPFKNNRHWHVTVGFYYGNSTLIHAINTAESSANIQAANAFNSMYRKALGKESLVNFSQVGIENMDNVEFEKANEALRRWGARTYNGQSKGYNQGDLPDEELNSILGIDPSDNRFYSEYGVSLPIGTLERDIIAEEDIYYDYSEKLDNPYYIANGEEVTYRTDANGRQIKAGSIRYHKGEVVRKAGEQLRFVPNADNTITADANVNRFKPYVGIGFDTHITKDKRTHIAFEAGVMFWGGRPRVDITTPVGMDANGNTVYANVDLVRDLRDMPSNIESYIKKVRMLPVFPELSLRISQRLW